MAGKSIAAAVQIQTWKWVGLLPRNFSQISRNTNFAKYQSLNFEDHESAYRHKTTGELVRALAVLQLCAFDGFVNNSLKLMRASQRVLGAKLFEAIIRPTFYDQFVAGDDGPSMRKTIDRLNQSLVRPMIACMMEEDEFITGKEKEKEFGENLRRIINCIELLGEVRSRRPTLQVKMTGIMAVPLVVKIGELSMNEATQLRLARYFTKVMVTGETKPTDLEGILEARSEANLSLLLALQRLKKIGEAAQQYGVTILVDAEYISMNNGLSTFALAMMGAYNKERPWIWATIQCYLKDALNNMQCLVQQADKLGVCFGVKIVRGAYMDRERQLADELGYPSPINTNYKETGTMYNNVVDSMLTHIKRCGTRCNIVVATHNEEAVRFALQRVQDLDIDVGCGCVNFAQLYGMCEQITIPLAQAGLIVYKSIPYGCVSEVLPYLYRRATENRSVIAGARKERTLLWKELKNRIF